MVPTSCGPESLRSGEGARGELTDTGRTEGFRLQEEHTGAHSTAQHSTHEGSHHTNSHTRGQSR